MNAEQFSSALGKVNDKYIMEAITYEKKSGWLKWGVMAACFGLIVTVAVVALPGLLNGPGGVSPDPGTVVITGDEPSPSPEESGGLSHTDPLQPPERRDVPINWDSVTVNESAGLAPDACRLYRDPAIYDEIRLDKDSVRDYYGWELAPGYVPEGFTGGGSGPWGCLVREKETGKVVEDQAGRGFWVDFWEDGSPKSDDDIVIPEGFTISASRLGILHCCLLPVDGSQTTDFGGVPVTLSHASLPYGPFDPTQKDPSGLYNLPAGYYDIYTASFTLDGVEYEIEGQRLELEEVIKITASIINFPYSEDFAVGRSQNTAK